MKKERYIVEIEMPDGDGASSTYICDVLQSDADIEDEDRWKVSVKECWKPSDEQMQALDFAADCIVPAEFCIKRKVLKELLEQLKKLKS